ncbi:MAG: hypothetical protein EPN88_04930 [Bacteroidetes bacterium]|nr:MAG: hypothetical protein EPN88_04930 [Bacteroidota bacterium]
MNIYTIDFIRTIPAEAYSVIATIIFSNVVISIFYHVFKLKWPDLYFSVNNMDAFFISVSFKRYLLFRFLPCFLIGTLAVSIFTKNLAVEIAYIAGLSSLFVHSLLTNGRAILDLLTKSKRIKIYFNYGFQIVLHLFTIVFLSVLGVISGVASRSSIFMAITPSIEGLVDNIWAALLTVIIVEYLRVAYAEKSIKIDEVFSRSVKNINPNLFNHIDENCPSQKANPILVKAVCIVENIQRPKWIRKIENIKAFLRLCGTYGIMQVKSTKFISDEKSIDIAIKNYFSNSQGINNIDELKIIISKFNALETYNDLVIQAMYYLDPNSANYPG